MKINRRLVLAFFLLIIFCVQARSVTMNMAFAIDNDKTNDVIHVNGTDYPVSGTTNITFTGLDKKYISSERSNTLAGLVFAGSEFTSAAFNMGYSSSKYLLRMTQDDAKNRFLITLTRGGWNDADNDAKNVEAAGMLSTRFGNITFTAPQTFPLFIRLQYDTINLLTRLKMEGPTQLLIKNTGTTSRPNITMSVQ